MTERRGGRRKGRELALRALFEADITGDNPVEVLELALGHFHLTQEGRQHALAMVAAARSHLRRIDRLVSKQLEKWSLQRIGGIERNVLRLATAELLYTPDVPARVILDEAVRLAERYGEEQSASFVNGVLDKIAHQVRRRELAEPTGPTETAI